MAANPRIPQSDTEVLETLITRAGDVSARELLTLRRAAAQAPQDIERAYDLAQRYFDTALASGDPRYVGYAEAVVKRFSEPLPTRLMVLRGILRQYRHDFSGALNDLAEVLQRDPQNATAHAWRGAIFLVQANYAKAETACEAIRRLNRPTLAGGCLGLTLAYSGNLNEGYLTLQTALNQTTNPDNRLWLLTRMGEVAAWRNQPFVAESHFQSAIAVKRDDVYLLAAWSDFLLDSGRFEEVVRLLEKWEAADSLLLRLAEAHTALKLPTAKRLQKLMAERYAAARDRGDTTHRAEESRFELGLRKNAAAALRLAEVNYADQREPRDARVLLEAAIAAGNSNAAKPVLDWLQRSGFEDPRMRSLAQAAAKGRP